MSDVEWDADDFEPVDAKQAAAKTDKWEGEDEDDELKDNWDDEDGEKKEGEAGGEQKAIQKKKKRSVKDAIAEKEAKALKEKEEKKKQDEEALKNMTPEARLAEKLRQQKMVEESDLELAKEAFGISNDELKGDGLDAALPITKEDFEKFADQLREKITKFEKSTHYIGFLEKLYRELALGLEADDIKKLGSTLNVLGNEKSKQEKGGKKKKSKKANLTVGKSNDLLDEDGGYDEFDDFL